jgi:hypothetical protein
MTNARRFGVVHETSTPLSYLGDDYTTHPCSPTFGEPLSYKVAESARARGNSNHLPTGASVPQQIRNNALRSCRSEELFIARQGIQIHALPQV